MASYLVAGGGTGLALDLDQVVLPVGFWDITAIGAATVSGGTLSGAGPLGRGPVDYWQCTATSQTLTVDLGASHNLRGVSFGTSWRADSTRIPAGYAIDYSTDGSTWTNLVTVSNNTNPYVTVLPANNAAITARYVRLTVTAFQSGQSTSNIAGFQIFSDENASGFGQLPFVLDGSGYIQNRIGSQLTFCGPKSTPALTIYPSGGVFVGSSPSDPGAGNLTVTGTVQTQSTLVARRPSSTSDIAFSIQSETGADILDLGLAAGPGHYANVAAAGDAVLRNAAGNRVIIGLGTSANNYGAGNIVGYPSGGVYIGANPSDPGANNLTVQGSITIGWQTSYQSKDSTSTARQMSVLAGDNNWYFFDGPGGYWNIRNFANTATVFSTNDSGLVKVGTDQLIVHRHPYGGNRHIESGSGTTPASGQSTVSFTYTKAFTSTPNVTATIYQTSLYNIPQIAVYANSTTGMTIQCGSGASQANNVSFYWQAEGPG